ncbi:hypothetical protein B0H66DRAFT_533890 [Apodospora peruviana]|uniref:Uncharacterized protein n=1 Tax=Apodospora peruviana TaxID=516989 RepID=A0AAE0I679_9PEZI|nr:hypothetical protein B0H66DRAFT_533890 [Apodospora peruviana]
MRVISITAALVAFLAGFSAAGLVPSDSRATKRGAATAAGNPTIEPDSPSSPGICCTGGCEYCEQHSCNYKTDSGCNGFPGRADSSTPAVPNRSSPAAFGIRLSKLAKLGMTGLILATHGASRRGIMHGSERRVK